jgi:type VI secretion system protein ImpJ
MTGKLARVRWKMGQALLPDHFMAQEEALLADVQLRSRIGGLPPYGFAAVRWNDSLLSEGVLTLQAATLVLPSGQLLKIPDSVAASPMNLNVPGTTSVLVYLHYLGEQELGPEQPGGGWSAETEQDVPRVKLQIALSAEQNYPDALESLRLAEFAKDPEGIWRLTDQFVPPLLMIGTSPFLQEALTELPQAMEVFQFKLIQDSASYLSGGSLHGVKQCLKSVYRVQRLLADLGGQVHLHPYTVLEALKELYVEICFYRGTTPKHANAPYNHDQLATCFANVLDPLVEQMRLAEKQSPYLPFEFRDGVYSISLPAEMRQAKAVFFLVHKNQVSRSVALESFKMAAPSRLSMVHKLALPGIPVQRIDRPILAHSFGPEVDFFKVDEGEEWESALREEAVAFYNAPAFEELEFYLYWHFG